MQDVSFIKILAFIGVFSLGFIALGASASLIGHILLQYQPLLRKVSGFIIIIFALHLIGILEIKKFYQEKHWVKLNTNKGWAESFFLLAFFWNRLISLLTKS